MKLEIRIKVECKELRTYEDALRIAREKERKQKKLAHMHYEMPMVQWRPEILSHKEVEAQKLEAKSEESMKEQIHEMDELMQGLSLNLMNGKGRGRPQNGYGRGNMPSTSVSGSWQAGRGPGSYAPYIRCFNCTDAAFPWDTLCTSTLNP